jgi:hypothetical protein
VSASPIAPGCAAVLHDGTVCPEQAPSSRYCAGHRHLEARDLEMLKLVSEHFRLDLQLFWQRGSLYLVVTAALLSVYASTGTGAAHWALAVFGLIVSAFWFAVSRASAYWIDRWTDELMRADRVVNPTPAIATMHEETLKRPWLVPSTISQWLPLVIAASWIGLMIWHAD